MATETSSRRRIGKVTASVIYGGELLWCIFSIVSVVSLLIHELSRHPVYASSEFEGFDFEEGDTEDELTHSFSSISFPTPLTTTQSHASDFHDGPHSPIPEPADPVPNPSPVEDEWDEDEFEGFPSQIHSGPMQEKSSSPEFSLHNSVSVEGMEEDKVGKKKILLRDCYVDIFCVWFLLCFGCNFFIGRNQNKNIAMAWAVKFATKDALFEKNFNLMGSGISDEIPLLLSDGYNIFKFYASGRKYCHGFLATLELKSRHDLISRWFTELILPKMETITFEVTMNDDAMDQVVFALVRKKLSKNILKDESDLQRYAGLALNAPSERKWVAEDLLVLSESKEVAGDIITDAVLDLVSSFFSSYVVSFLC